MRITLVELAVLVAICAILVALLLPGPPRHWVGEASREKCRDNLHTIALALHNYHDDHHCFPPAYIADTEGRPMHSWRVLILPYLDQQALYERYDITQPWDAPDNANLAEEFPTPEVYRCPSDAHDGAGSPDDTSYLAIVGPHTCWPGAEPVSLDQVSDDSEETLLVVESSDSGIHWMEPRDLHISQMAMTVNPDTAQGIASPHPGGAFVMRVDGAVRFVANDLDAETLRRLIERDDGERVVGF
jgi:hypothetical protein